MSVTATCCCCPPCCCCWRASASRKSSCSLPMRSLLLLSASAERWSCSSRHTASQMDQAHQAERLSRHCLGVMQLVLPTEAMRSSSQSAAFHRGGQVKPMVEK